MNNTEQLKICHLCQDYTNHKTSQCPTLICANCGHHGHAKKHCQNQWKSHQNEDLESSPASTHYNPEDSCQSLPNSISDRQKLPSKSHEEFKLFVTNLAESVTSEDLYVRFRPKIVTVPYQGTAELTFYSKDQLSNAISTWHNTSINGKEVKCYLANIAMMRLKVTNLNSNVDKRDLYQLFSHVGQLESLRMSAKGKARISFKFKEDAIPAVKFYHNRLLDDQPMKCYLEPIKYLGISKVTNEDRVELQVTNLEGSVNADQLLHLYSKIGPMKSITGPINGTAKVNFCNVKDAESAIQVYHNQIFNGRPMKCSLLSIK